MGTVKEAGFFSASTNYPVRFKTFLVQGKRYSSPYNWPWRPRWGEGVQHYSFFNLGAKWGGVDNSGPNTKIDLLGLPMRNPELTVQIKALW